ncbi:hypothetical protein B0H14DRAFT_3161543 [Mycena olivaceomarginata]|nr:hypothetical protein B0H14DRAFT_3161543 [Mycena olivaceomarginata]
MENIHQVLYAIINLYLKSETAGSLDPAMLDHIGKFMGTLRKIYKFVEAQQDRNKIKYLFHNNEMRNLLKDCHVGLDQAVEVFAINTRPAIVNDIGEMKKTAQTMHEELLELIQSLSDTSTSSDGSSPKIFYGRESELDHIMKMIAQQPARIAILGGGGMGKTSLARAVLHHPETSAKFEHRFLSVQNLQPPALNSLHLLDYILDWILAKILPKLLSSIFQGTILASNSGQPRNYVEHLTLIITMRGAERPAKVYWTHPFLLPLEPLSDEAAQQPSWILQIMSMGLRM